jgi:hypothetical protein
MTFLLRRVVIAMLIPFLWRLWRERRRSTAVPARPVA